MKIAKSQRKNWKIFIFALVVISSVGSYAYFKISEPKIGKNVLTTVTNDEKMTYPSQYSDSHITLNAIVSDHASKT